MKMLRGGTPEVMAVQTLRMMMDASQAPRDDRWHDRYDDIPRAVASAGRKLAAEQTAAVAVSVPQPAPAPASPPPPPPIPPVPGSQPAAAQPSSPPPGATPVEDTLKVFQKWLLLNDWTPVYTALGTIAANMLPGDPVWFGLVAPPSSAKTEILKSLSKIPNAVEASTLTPAALLSGTPRQQQAASAKGGLLRQIGQFGFLVLKDFGSIIDMRPDDRNVLLAAFREVYDGSWTRHVGADGGKVLHWSGKIGLLFGATGAIDTHYNIISKMGDRFLFNRLTPCDEQFEYALNHIGTATQQMRQELAEAVANLFAGPLRQPQKITEDEKAELKPIVLLATRLRGAVDRDSHSREFLGIQGAEGPSRLTLTLERLLAGLDTLGVDRKTALKVVISTAMDSVPPNRRRVYKHLETISPAWADTSAVAKAVDLPTITARRVLEELTGYRLTERTSGGQGKADLWRKR
jgi:hypothetical protein